MSGERVRFPGELGGTSGFGGRTARARYRTYRMREAGHDVRCRRPLAVLVREGYSPAKSCPVSHGTTPLSLEDSCVDSLLLAYWSVRSPRQCRERRVRTLTRT